MNLNRPYYDFFAQGSEQDGLSEYGFSILKNRKSLGITLDGPPYTQTARMKTVLVFATYNNVTGLGRTAAILARNNAGRVAILHSGKVFARDGRGQPFFDKTALVGNKKYFLVSYLDDRNILKNLVRFHRSRVISLDRASDVGGDVYDPGVEHGGERKAVVFEAAHHPITKMLKDKMIDLGWEVEQDSLKIRPDLLMTKDDRSILFEVKPNGKSHDYMMGAAQLLIYNRLVGADLMCLVTSKPKKTHLADAIGEFLTENEIEYVEVKFQEGRIIFDGLAAVVE